MFLLVESIEPAVGSQGSRATPAWHTSMPSEGGTSFLVRGVLRRHLWARYRHFREREERMYRIWYWAMISRENDGRFVASIPDLGDLAA